MIQVNDAQSRFQALAPPPRRTALCLLREARHKTLANDVLAHRPHPPFHRVAMDGIALCADHVRNRPALEGKFLVQLEGVQAAGAPQKQLPPNDGAFPPAFEVMTGAVLPAGCDVVIPYEQVDLCDGMATFDSQQSLDAMRNVHVQGSDYDRGHVVLQAGHVIDGVAQAILASLGETHVSCANVFSVAMVTTGDELVPPGAPPKAHQVYASNGAGVAGLLADHDLDVQVTHHHVDDDFDQTCELLQALLLTSSVVLLSGGVSKGKFDHVPRALAHVGVDEVFHRVRQKPGKPLYLGTGPDGQVVVGLPGNPVASLVCTRMYVVPAIRRWLGLEDVAPAHCRMSAPGGNTRPLTAFVGVHVDDDGWATVVEHNGSGDIASLARCTGFAVIPQDTIAYDRGQSFSYIDWTS